METEKQRTEREAQWSRWIEGVRVSAQAAWDSGRAFHVVQLRHGGTHASFMAQSVTDADDVAGALQVIEAVGWRLDQTGYVYQPLRERSHALTDSANMTGNIIGIYTFRRPLRAPPMPEA